MRRLKSEVVGGTFWMAVGIFFGFGAVKLDVGTLQKPGEGFLPLIMALILVFLSLLIFIKGAIRSRPVSQIPWRRNALATSSVFFFGLILDFIGFLSSAFILMLILFGLSTKGKRNWSMIFLYSAVTALLTWLTFSVILRVPFPFSRLMTIWG